MITEKDIISFKKVLDYLNIVSDTRGMAYFEFDVKLCCLKCRGFGEGFDYDFMNETDLKELIKNLNKEVKK